MFFHLEPNHVVYAIVELMRDALVTLVLPKQLHPLVMLEAWNLEVFVYKGEPDDPENIIRLSKWRDSAARLRKLSSVQDEIDGVLFKNEFIHEGLVIMGELFLTRSLCIVLCAFDPPNSSLCPLIQVHHGERCHR